MINKIVKPKYTYDFVQEDGSVHWIDCGMPRHALKVPIIHSDGSKTFKEINVFGYLFTGMFDKNGNKIFEGDIVKFKNFISNVFFIAGGLMACIGSGDKTICLADISCDELEVVGHIDEKEMK